jgi:diguanylate cyclase (GGDEF)-like protein/PAS domain S-box-containing protein
VLEATLDTIRDAVLITEPHPTLVITFANAAFYTLTGYTPAEVIGNTPALLQGRDTAPDWLDIFRPSAPAAGRPPVEITSYHKDGTPRQLEWSVRSWPAGKQAQYLVAVQRDVTGLRDLERHHLQLQVLTQMQQLVSTAGLDLRLLRQKVADVALEATGAEAAVVEEARGDDMVYTAVAGKARSLTGLRLPLDASLSGVCYQEQMAIFCPDTHQDSRVARAAADEIGFRSGLLVPLLHEGLCFGALKVYSGRPHAFRQEQLELLEMASQVLTASLHDARRFKREQDRRTLLVDALPILISFIDDDYRYREINAAYTRWFDLEPDKVLGQKVSDVLGREAFNNIHGYMAAALAGDQVRFETTVPYARGGTRPVEAEYIPVWDGEGHVLGFYALVRDISERKSAERDYLTRAYNRRGFDQRMEVAFATARRYGRPLSLLFLDIDNFKPVNDQCGHDVGDRILQKVANLLMRLARESDTVCRWGGEEFAVLAPETGLAEAMELAERLRQAIANEVASPLGPITVSIGVVERRPRESRKQLARRADKALYQAKDLGRDRVEAPDS